MNELTRPDDAENSRPLKKAEKILSNIGDAKKETKRLRMQTAIPAIKAIKNELVARAKDGRLKEQLAQRSLGSLLRDLSIIKQVLDDNMPNVVVVTPQVSPKDETWIKANSATAKTPRERALLRAKVLEAEAVKENPQ